MFQLIGICDTSYVFVCLAVLRAFTARLSMAVCFGRACMRVYPHFSLPVSLTMCVCVLCE